MRQDRNLERRKARHYWIVFTAEGKMPTLTPPRYSGETLRASGFIVGCLDGV